MSPSAKIARNGDIPIARLNGFYGQNGHSGRHRGPNMNDYEDHQHRHNHNNPHHHGNHHPAVNGQNGRQSSSRRPHRGSRSSRSQRRGNGGGGGGVGRGPSQVEH